MSITGPWQSLVGAELPTARAFEQALGSPVLEKLVLVAALLGLLTSWNGFFLAGSRVLFALGRGRMAPAFLERTHAQSGAPTGAVLVSGAATLLGACLGRGAMVAFIDVGSFCIALAFFGVSLSAARLRRTQPDLPRPYRMPLGQAAPWLSGMGALFILAMMIWPGSGVALTWPLEWLLLLVVSGTGLLAWVLASARRRAPTSARGQSWCSVSSRSGRDDCVPRSRCDVAWGTRAARSHDDAPAGSSCDAPTRDLRALARGVGGMFVAGARRMTYARASSLPLPLAALTPLSRLLIAGFALALAGSAGCGTFGERARTRACPDGEVCSPTTPSGLVFTGASVSGGLLGSSGLHPTALGGVQGIHVATRFGERLPPFEVDVADEGVLVARVTGSRSIGIEGVGDGSSLVRILDVEDGGTLLDRITLGVGIPDHAEVTAPGDLLMATAPEPRSTVFGPGSHTVVVHLVSVRGGTLVDEAMEVAAIGGEARRGAWDRYAIELPPEGMALDVTSAALAYRAVVDATDTLDGVEIAGWLYQSGGMGPVQVGRGSMLCAIGLAGERWVLGGGGASVVSAQIGGVDVEVTQMGYWHCADVPDAAPAGDTVVSFAIDGVSGAITVDVAAPGAAASSLVSASSSFELPSGPSWSLGDRGEHAAWP